MKNSSQRPAAAYRRAIGLEYADGSDRAPELSLKCDADQADEIVRLARRFGVPVVEQPSLARTLDTLELGAIIPESLYRAVALILNYVERCLARRSR